MISYIDFDNFRRSFEIPRSRRLVTVGERLSDDKSYIRVKVKSEKSEVKWSEVKWSEVKWSEGVKSEKVEVGEWRSQYMWVQYLFFYFSIR